MAHDENSDERLWRQIAARKQSLPGSRNQSGQAERNGGASHAEGAFLDALQLALSAQNATEMPPQGHTAARARLLATIHYENGTVPSIGRTGTKQRTALPWKSSRTLHALLIALLTLVIAAAVGLLIQQVHSDACRLKQGENTPQTMLAPRTVSPEQGQEESRNASANLPNANRPPPVTPPGKQRTGMANSEAGMPKTDKAVVQQHCE